jgi:uncharacterized protein YjaZ
MTLGIMLIVNSKLFAQDLHWTVEFRDSSGVIAPELKRLIENLTIQTQYELQELLPSKKQAIKVIITLDSVNTIKETGNSGFPLSSTEISFTINPYHTLGMKAIITRYYRSTLYHEFNHILRGWTSVSSRNSTDFMDAVIAEGLATVFEMQFANSNPLWSNYPENVEEWVAELQNLSLTAYREYGKWMFEHPDGRKWIGYKSGTYIVEKALKLSGKTLLELTVVPTKEILALAGYK